LFSLDRAHMRALVSLICGFILCGCASTSENMPELFERPGGLVPDKRAAIAVAEAVLFPIYGEEMIREQRPYKVKHSDGTWTIEGADFPPGTAGGVFHIVIRQRDAKILEISHGA
jgi:hypothetical protein